MTKGGVEYLVKGTQEPDSAGMCSPRENVERVKREFDSSSGIHKTPGRGLLSLLAAQRSQRNTSGFFYS